MSLKEELESYKKNIIQLNGDDSWMLPMPGRFVIERNSTIISADVSPDYTRRPDPEETLGVLKALWIKENLSSQKGKNDRDRGSRIQKTKAGTSCS
jgi:hypothetical protein